MTCTPVRLNSTENAYLIIFNYLKKWQSKGAKACQMQDTIVQTKLNNGLKVKITFIFADH